MKTIGTLGALLLGAACILPAVEAPDAAFVAKVEAAMAVIRSQRQVVADKEWAEMSAKLTPAKRSNERDLIMFAMAGLFTEEIVALRIIPAERGIALAIRLSTDEAAKRAAERLPLPTAVSGSWMILNPDDRHGSGVRELQLAINAKAWDPARKEWVPAPTAEEIAAVIKTKAEAEVAAGRVMILKSVLFPAQVQFQAGGYIDPDNNGRGSYGFLSELSGGPIPGITPIVKFMPDEFTLANPVKNGQAFAVFLPGADATKGVGSRAEIAKLPLDQNQAPLGESLRESQFVAYAWPATGATGTMIAITPYGTVFEHAWDGTKPAWNALWADGGEQWTEKRGSGWTAARR